MILARQLPDPLRAAIRGHVGARLETLRSRRLSWWAHWSQLAEMYLPRRYRWFVTPNQFNRGSPMNQSIVDETGLLAARILSTGLLSGLTSPTKPWFRLGLMGEDELPEGPAQIWLSEATDRMLEVLAGSNFYEALGTAYYDDVVFGSAALIQYEDPQTVCHFFNPCMGEFMFGLSAKLDVDTLYREYTYTVGEAVKAFGLENVSDSTQQMYKTAANLDTEVIIGHALEPNEMVYQGQQPVGYVVPKRFTYREVFWERTGSAGNRANHLIQVSGYHERPFEGFRWDVTSNDPYGRSPGMDALPAVRQLQIEQRRKAEGIDKLVRPPMVGSANMKNEPMDILPGGVTFVTDPAASGFRPAFQVEPRIQELSEDIEKVQARVGRIFFNDLFLGISQLGTVRTATEIEARKAETLVQIGPVIERTENNLSGIVKRTYAIMSRRGLIPPPPPEIAGRPLNIEYISMLAETQRAAATAAIERYFGFIGSLIAVKPDAADNADFDAGVGEYAELLNVKPELVRAAKAVMAIRAQRDQAQQAQAALQVGQAAAQGAQTLSQADIGGGKNALQAMVGG